jgi:hypothetical protein
MSRRSSFNAPRQFSAVEIGTAEDCLAWRAILSPCSLALARLRMTSEGGLGNWRIMENIFQAGAQASDSDMPSFRVD